MEARSREMPVRRKWRKVALGCSIAAVALLFGIVIHLLARGRADEERVHARSPAASDFSHVEDAKSSGPAATPALPISTADIHSRMDGKYSIRHLASDFFRLAALADAGDLGAAKALWRALERCSLGPRNQAELDSRVRAMLSDRYTVPESVPGGRQALVESLKESFARCGELSIAQAESRKKWISQLAEAGDTDARLEFPFSAQPDGLDLSDYAERRSAFVESAKEYLNAEINSGNSAALSAMAHSFMAPVLAGQTTPFVVDSEQAYKFFFAHALSGSASPSTESILARLENSMSAEQIQHAREEGRRIFEACCRG